jgi:N-acetylglucosamine kinase-like BadF-type ATPase
VTDGVAIGIDAGASKTTGVLVSADGSLLRRETAGGANIAANGRSVAASNLRQVVEPLARDAAVRSVCIAAAGSAHPARRMELEAIVHGLIPREAHLTICHDARAWLRASTESRPAMVVAAGTGSIAYGERADGTAVRAGGYGRTLGDAGSGYAIGLAGLRSACRALDGLEPRGTLANAVLARIEAEATWQVMEFASGDLAAVAALAPIVNAASEAKDQTAREILEQQARGLGELARAVAHAVRDAADLPVVTAGGAFEAAPGMVEGVRAAVATTGRCTIVRPNRDAALGAALIALEALQE